MYNSLLKKIQESNKITLFKHINPDGDANFSCAALKEFIKFNFKGKQVKIAGNDVYDIFDVNQNVTDNFIKNSLVIVLDTSGPSRVDDNRYILGKYIVKIDHHPPLEQYGDLNIVEPKMNATCELLGNIFLSKTFKKYEINKKCAEYLCSGLITDTLCLKINGVNENTLKLASYLVSKGASISRINSKVFEIPLDEFNKDTILRSYLKVDGKLGYLFLDSKDLKKIGLNKDKIKNAIKEFSIISELNIWLIIVKNESKGAFEATIRSKEGYTINSIANKHGGGGHKNASGIPYLTKEKTIELLKDLQKLANRKI